MSDDQLSWDQLFKNSKESAKSDDSSDDSSDAAPEAPSKEALKAVNETPATKKKSRTKKAAPKASGVGLQDLYSKKDWSPLAITVPIEANAAAKPDMTAEAKAEIAKLQTAINKKKVVAIPVVRSASQLPYADEDDHQEATLEKQESKEPKVISVSELNKHIRDILEGRFPLLWLKAEISNFKAHTSGHFYFSLKDSKAQISAVMFRGFNTNLRFRPEDGMEVLVRGKVTVYEPRGNYQIFCEMMEPVGAGALQKAYEQLKAKLQKEGLFDQDRKRTLPAHPRHIAIVTSPTGAAIRDMLNVLGRRFKGVHITVVPCKVQGDAAPGEIVDAITLAQKLSDVDVMIVGRGGGSIEDLWAFNDERVALAIASSRVPVISAVGHEVDFTIADFVADLRAPTPSAAAELVVQNAADLISRISSLTRTLRLALGQRLESSGQELANLARRLIDPQRMLQDAALRSDELMQRLGFALERKISDQQGAIALLKSRLGTPQARIDRYQDTRKTLSVRLATAQHSVLRRKTDAIQKYMAVLDSLSPLKVLDRGFSMVVLDSKIISQAKELKVGDEITVRMCEGSVDAKITKVKQDKR